MLQERNISDRDRSGISMVEVCTEEQIKTYKVVFGQVKRAEDGTSLCRWPNTQRITEIDGPKLAEMGGRHSAEDLLVLHKAP